MIPEVDVALEALVRREAVNGSRVDVLFDAPTKEWVARRNAPTVDLYLYDIREDLPRRELAREAPRDPATGFVSGYAAPPRRFRLSYLVTAWTQRPEDEHRLLAACLASFVRNEFIPLDLVPTPLSEARYPVYLHVCLPPPQDRSIADVWSALGGELKPSLDLIAIAPLDPRLVEPVAAPVLEAPTLGVGGPGIAAEEALGGRARRGRRGATNGHGPLGPGDPADQSELIRGSGPGIERPLEADRASAEGGTAAGRKGKATKGAKGGAAEADGEAEEGPDLSGLGGGRIIRVRGISRP